MDRQHTPFLKADETHESHETQIHHPTPTRAKIQGAINFCEIMNILYFKNDVFRVFDVFKQIGYKLLNDFNRMKHNADVSETRERNGIVTFQHIRKMERVLETKGMKARDLTWKQLDYEMKLKCSDRTIQRVMKTMDYHKCVACRKSWINESTIKRRVEWATVMKKKYSDKKDWHEVRFSDEMHYAYDSQEKIRIIRKSNQRYCQNCIQHTDESTEKNKKKCTNRRL